MSLYRARDQLTRDTIQLILGNLAQQGRLDRGSIVKKVQAGLDGQSTTQEADIAEIKRLIHYLKARGYLTWVYGRGERAIYHLSTKGWRRLEDLKYRPLAEKGKSWDGKWRLLVFDIPEDQRAVRDNLRRLIKRLGFVQLQRSVWIQPLPCEEEIAELKGAYNLTDSSITLFLIESFIGQKDWEQKFASELRQT